MTADNSISSRSGYVPTPPFEIYLNGNEISDAHGHFCTAESPEIAEALLALLNGTFHIAQAAPEPVAYRWRNLGSVNWIYDPEPAWFEQHKHEIEWQSLAVVPSEIASPPRPSHG